MWCTLGDCGRLWCTLGDCGALWLRDCLLCVACASQYEPLPPPPPPPPPPELASPDAATALRPAGADQPADAPRTAELPSVQAPRATADSNPEPAAQPAGPSGVPAADGAPSEPPVPRHAVDAQRLTHHVEVRHSAAAADSRRLLELQQMLLALRALRMDAVTMPGPTPRVVATL